MQPEISSSIWFETATLPRQRCLWKFRLANQPLLLLLLLLLLLKTVKLLVDRLVAMRLSHPGRYCPMSKGLPSPTWIG